MYFPFDEPSRFLANIKEEPLKSGESHEEYLEKAYRQWLEYFKNEYGRYERHLKLNLKARYEFERIVKELVDLLKANGIHNYSDECDTYHGKPFYDLESIYLYFEKNGSDNLHNVTVAARESCGATIMFEKTPEEIEKCARDRARFDLELELNRQKQEKERKSREEADRKAYQQAYEKFLEEKEESNRKLQLEGRQVGKTESKVLAESKAADDWKDPYEEDRLYAKQILDEIRCHDAEMESDFIPLYDSLDNALQSVIYKYVKTCHEFSAAMNGGLTGLSLYPFNERRSNAHEEMLEAFGLEDDYAARDATKNYDYTDTYDPVERKYWHRPLYKSLDYLAYVLVRCRDHMLLKKAEERTKELTATLEEALEKEN